MIAGKSWTWDNAETCRFSHISPFSIMSIVEALNLIFTCVEKMYSLYPYDQRLLIEINSYVLPEVMEFDAVISFFMITHIELDIVY